MVKKRCQVNYILLKININILVENLVGNGAKAIVADIVKNNQHDGNKSIDYRYEYCVLTYG